MGDRLDDKFLIKAFSQAISCEEFISNRMKRPKKE